MIKVDQYTSLNLEEYKGTYAIIEGWIGRDGTFKPSWCTREIGKEKTEKKMPVRVKLGDKDNAIKALTMLLEELKGDKTPF
jgi:hypothetical protein